MPAPSPEVVALMRTCLAGPTSAGVGSAGLLGVVVDRHASPLGIWVAIGTDATAPIGDMGGPSDSMPDAILPLLPTGSTREEAVGWADVAVLLVAAAIERADGGRYLVGGCAVPMTPGWSRPRRNVLGMN